LLAIGGSAFAATPTPDPAPEASSPPPAPAPPADSSSSEPSDAPAPVTLTGARSTGSVAGATTAFGSLAGRPAAIAIVSGTTLSAAPLGASDAAYGGSRTGGGSSTAETVGLALSLVLLGLAALPRRVLAVAGTPGAHLLERRWLVAVLGLAVAVGVLANLVLGGVGA
jgi:hypothetical protein